MPTKVGGTNQQPKGITTIDLFESDSDGDLAGPPPPVDSEWRDRQACHHALGNVATTKIKLESFFNVQHKRDVASTEPAPLPPAAVSPPLEHIPHPLQEPAQSDPVKLTGRGVPATETAMPLDPPESTPVAPAPTPAVSAAAIATSVAAMPGISDPRASAKRDATATDHSNVSDDDLSRFIKDSAFEVPFMQDRNSDGRVTEIANYYHEVATSWPWLQDSYLTATLSGTGSIGVKLPTGDDRRMLPPLFNVQPLLSNKYVRLAGTPLYQLASLTQPKINIFSELFDVPSIFREAVGELLPNVKKRATFATLDSKLAKLGDKITVRTKAASLAKIRLARDFARCKVVGVIVESIRNHNLTFTSPSEKVEIPGEWLDFFDFKFAGADIASPTECSRPEMVYHPYHSYLLFHVELALRAAVHSNSAGPAKKKARMATASAFEEEVQSPLVPHKVRSTASKSRPHAARTFLDTQEVDASKLDRLRSVDLQPTFESLCKTICVTYDLLEVASIRMKAVTAVTLQMKVSLAEAEATLRRAEGLKMPKSRRGHSSPEYVERGYFDQKLNLIIQGMNLNNKTEADQPYDDDAT